MTPDDRDLGRCLTQLQTAFPYSYAQWVIEDPESHDYRVIASIIPEGEQGYDVAHRTGVIGQVFRIEKPILVPNARNHPLYDPFDKTIEWEIAFPVFADESMSAVVNLEGTDILEVAPELWLRLAELVYESTGCRMPSSLPTPDSSTLIKTRRVAIREASDDDIIDVARGLARDGSSTLLVGHYPDLLRGRTPTLDEAIEQGLSPSYCYFGFECRFDLLATGPVTKRDLLDNLTTWWHTCDGRYSFVLI